MLVLSLTILINQVSAESDSKNHESLQVSPSQLNQPNDQLNLSSVPSNSAALPSHREVINESTLNHHSWLNSTKARFNKLILSKHIEPNSIRNRIEFRAPIHANTKYHLKSKDKTAAWIVVGIAFLLAFGIGFALGYSLAFDDSGDKVYAREVGAIFGLVLGGIVAFLGTVITLVSEY